MSRPRSFDQTEALDAALASFWGRGFEATSVRDLAGAMGMSGPSLYNAFGDKRGLFSQALEHYCRTRTYPLLARMEARHPGAAAVPAFFAEIIERSLCDRERRGCFLINSALETAPHDEVVAEAVGVHLDAIRAFLLRGVRAACAGSAEAAADHLLAVLLGVRVLARTRPDRGILVRTVRAALLATGYDQAQLRALPVAGSSRNRRGPSGAKARSSRRHSTRAAPSRRMPS